NVFLDLYPAQKELYLAQLKKTKEEMDELMSTEGFTKARFKILQLLTKLRQICIDPTIIFENYKGGSVKIDNLISLVKEIIDNDHKILIFTSYRTALEIVKERFNKDKISSYIIDGSVSSKKRMELVDAFNTDSTNVFLIMLKAGGTGLNLTSADVVIHLDLWWNPQVENQATDRTHRIGQKNTVEVIRLICKGTIEERILELQNKKKILSDTLIEGKNRDQNIISKLTEKDIKNILAFDNSEE
ncbi:MAG: C-terminal helicase domain-containing protein, partial [Bacilli bacterium]